KRAKACDQSVDRTYMRRTTGPDGDRTVTLDDDSDVSRSSPTTRLAVELRTSPATADETVKLKSAWPAASVVTSVEPTGLAPWPWPCASTSRRTLRAWV